MRLHIFFNGHRPGTLDIDKKIPMLTKIYPDCKIKKISFNRNKKTELNRQLKEKYKSLKNSIRHQENMKNDKGIPADFQEEVIAFHGKFVEAEKKSIERLKAKI
jgi:hypothetical protein